MKKILFCLLAVSFFAIPAWLDAQQNQPHYFHSPYAGLFAVGWALNDLDREVIEFVERFVQNGRFYFVGAALPVSSGNLMPGFQFNLDWYNRSNPRMLAVYQGPSRGPVPSGLLAIEPISRISVRNNGIFVAGYAVRGSITITHVFMTDEDNDFFSSVLFTAF